MLEWIAEKLGIASLMPWPRAAVGFILTILSSLLGWAISDVPWAAMLLAMSVVFGVWTLVESLGHPVKGFFIGLLSWYLVLGTDTAAKLYYRLPYIGCTVTDRDKPQTCLDQALEKAAQN